VADPLSVDDLFTVGVSFDLLGGYLLGRGLLASPLDIARRNTSLFGQGLNAPEAASQIRSNADAFVGLLSLATGFLLQAGGYVALIAGATVHTGGARAALAVGLAVMAAVAAWFVLQRLHRNRVLHLAVEAARSDPLSGRMAEYPDGNTLMELGQQLGFPFVEITRGVPDLDAYGKRHFGVERVARRYPPEFPAPPASHAPRDPTL
jgi:hypothetical protein